MRGLAQFLRHRQESSLSEKVYAPGIGRILDDEFVLTRHAKIL
jgi:hypothetical protein